MTRLIKLIVVMAAVIWSAVAGAEVLITVPSKSTGDTLSASEMNQVVGALKDGSYSAYTYSLHLKALTAAPSAPVSSVIYRADGNFWDPASLGISKSYYVVYDGSSYKPLWDEDGYFLFDTTAQPWSKPVSIQDVDGNEDGIYWTAPQDGTITGVTVVVDPGDTGDSVTVDVELCDSSTASTCTSVLSSTITAANGVSTGTIDTSADDFTSGQHLKLVIGSPTGTISLMTITVKGTY